MRGGPVQETQCVGHDLNGADVGPCTRDSRIARLIGRGVHHQRPVIDQGAIGNRRTCRSRASVKPQRLEERRKTFQVIFAFDRTVTVNPRRGVRVGDLNQGVRRLNFT